MANITVAKIKELLKGNAPVREDDTEEPPSKASAVPSAGGQKSGKPKDGEADAGGMEPQPT